ncbi:class I SAM-dependent methyltransferase [Agromyces seonyuensis]|nr:class I SAM-dependent methyltransferase [Agromyces seonyuensis]
MDAGERIDDDRLAELRADYVGRLHGRVLELGAGEGENLDLLSAGVIWAGIEPDDERRDRLAAAADAHGRPAPFAARAEELPLPDESVDAVLATWVLCSVDDLPAALVEVRRVLVPGGRVVFVDHVIAPPRTLKRFVQHTVTPFTAHFQHGCHWNRDPASALAEAGFAGLDVRRHTVTGRGPLGMPVLLFDGVLAA